MNMITTAFPIEADTASKQKDLVSKLISVWEKKNSKAARAGGVSLMALSLAACGAEDETPFAQSDIDAATAPLTAAVTTAQTQAATALVGKATAEAAQAAAETQAATALVAQAAAEATAATALVGKATAEAATATATSAKETAEASLIVAQAAQATAEASLATETAAKVAAQAAQTTAEASLVTAQAATTTVQASYDALIAPKSLALTAPATDVLVGGSGNDVITGSGSAIDAADSVIDESGIDSDTLTLTADANSFAAGTLNLPSIVNVETIVINASSLTAAITVDTANTSGNDLLTVTRSDVLVGGATLASGTQLNFTNVDITNTPVLASAGTVTARVDVTYDGPTVDGATLNLDTVTTTVNVVGGAATVNAAAATGTITMNDTAGSVNATAVVVNAATAATVNVGVTQNYDGDITVNAATAGTVRVDTTVGVSTINAANATAITVDDASGGGIVTGGSTSTADTTITVNDIDASNFTIATGTGTTLAATKQITLELDGSTGTGDTVTISGTGAITVDTNNGAQAVEILSLSGTSGEVTYTLQDADVVTTVTGTGTNVVNLTAPIAALEAATISGIDELSINTASAGNTADFDSISVGKIIVTVDLDANAGGEEVVNTDSGSTVEFRTNQSRTSVDADTATGSTKIIAGDVNGATTTVGNLTTGQIITSQATVNSSLTGTTGGTVTIEALESNLTSTGLIAWSQNVVITGDENVILNSGGGAASVMAASLNASGSTGNITLSVLDTVANTVDTTSVTTGSGTDNITLNGNGIVTVMSGGGGDTITVTDIAATSTLDGSEGTDTFVMTEAVTAYIAIGGAGNDTFNVGTNTGMAAIIIGGTGTDDTLVVGVSAGLDLTAASATFAISGVEVFDITALNNTMTMTSTQFANNNTVKLEGAGANDIFTVEGLATANVINAENLTTNATQNVTLNYSGGARNDTITGGVGNETIAFGSATNAGGGVDIIEGGGGTDTFDATLVRGVTETGSAASIGAVVNMGATAVTGTSIFSATGSYIAGSSTTVAAGKIAYLFAADSTANSTNASSISGVESITGSAGNDYLVGDAGANTITDGAGADYIVTGSGVDVLTAAGSVVLTATTLAVASIIAGQTVTFTNGVDVVADFTAGLGGDTIDTVGTAVTAIGVDHRTDTSAASYFLSGAWNAATKLFTTTAAGVGADTLIFNGDASANLNGIDDFVVLLAVDGTDLAANNFI